MATTMPRPSSVDSRAATLVSPVTRIAPRLWSSAMAVGARTKKRRTGIQRRKRSPPRPSWTRGYVKVAHDRLDGSERRADVDRAVAERGVPAFRAEVDDRALERRGRLVGLRA